MKKVLWNIIVIIYVVLAITVTVCLLTYNEYKITEIGKNTLIIINDNALEADYAKGTLVIAKKDNFDNIQVGEKVFFYKDNTINYGEIKRVNSYADSSPTYIMDGDYQLIVDDIVGTANSATVLPVLGSILSILESKIGFLMIIVLPSLIAFFHEIFEFIIEFREK